MNSTLLKLREHFESTLNLHLPESQHSLQNAMRYSVMNGGKRIRPLLVYAVAELLAHDYSKLDHVATSVELVHCYSLVHDDLPAMDDDDLRRGQPTCHIAFDEATAILVGDALQSFAFEILSQSLQSAEQKIVMIHVLSQAIGAYQGMCLGQALDMQAEADPEGTLDELKQIHECKTGQLIAASCQLAAIAAGHDINSTTYNNISKFALLLGQAFQIKDDILDQTSSTEVLGKPQGSDVKNDKLTYCKFFSIEALETRLEEMKAQCLAIIDAFDSDATLLRALTHMVFEREA